MMDESGIMNSEVESQLVYKEEVVPVEFVAPEPQECVVCVTVNFDSLNIFTSRTDASGTPLHTFLSKFTNTELPFCPGFVKYICRRCLNLANGLEKAEMDYVKLKSNFERIIDKNPVFHLQGRSEPVKEQEAPDSGDDESDLMSRSMEVCITVEEFPNNEVIEDGNKVFIQEAKPAGSDTNSSSEGVDKQAAKSFIGEDTAATCRRRTPRAVSKQPSSEPPVHDSLWSEVLLHEDDEYTPKGRYRPKCTICNRRFNSKRNLERHLQIHYDKKSYECNICQKRFNVHAYLRTHLIKMHGLVYECHICLKNFNSQDLYYSHLATHDGEDDQDLKYKCEFCPSRYRHKIQLTNHRRLHVKAKPEYEDNVPSSIVENSEGSFTDDTSVQSSLPDDSKPYVPAGKTEEDDG